MTIAQKLCKLMNLSHFRLIDVTKTSDGLYLGMPEGDIGFNAFIGRPQPVHAGPGLDRSLQVWAEFTETEKLEILNLAHSKGIDLVFEFGIPYEKSLIQKSNIPD